MSDEKFLKITWNNGEKKISTYFFPAGRLEVLKNDVALRYDISLGTYRIYWIDEDKDEIELNGQNDYEIFMSKCSQRLHLHVSSIDDNPTNQTNSAGATETDLPISDGPVHDHVECDSCNVAPIKGFRYKCIQCVNFDLCERCEAKHKHADHMMIRMPNPNCPNVVDAYLTGRSGRRSKRSSKSCPFMPEQKFGYFMPQPTEAAGDNAKTAAGGESGANQPQGNFNPPLSRKMHRRILRQGILSNIYDMMQDLAEGGAKPPTAPAAAAAGAATMDDIEAAAATAASAAATAAANAAEAAAASVEATFATQKEASKVNLAASHLAQNIANVFYGMAPPEPTGTNATEEPQQKKEETKTTSEPKTPPTTPDTTENKQSNTNENNTSIPQSPTIENLAQMIDPQYMRAGIQILNNFSEMFAKMLDPADGTADGACPFENLFERTQRKFSTSTPTTTTSANNSGPTSTTSAATDTNASVQPMNVDKEINNDQQEKRAPAENVVNVSMDADQSRRSQSEDGDWQMVDEQLNSSAQTAVADAVLGTTVENNHTEPIAQPEVVNVATNVTANVNYGQLGADLFAHIRQEQQLEQEQAAAAAAPTTSTTTTTNNATPETGTGAKAKTDEKRANGVYHPDQRINNAVYSMMAMGFSNEGAWLTQLLETVNGDIPAALDLMSAAQRRPQ